MLTEREQRRCGDCGMELASWAEHHTVEACEVYKLTHSPEIVREAMRAKQVEEAAARA